MIIGADREWKEMSMDLGVIGRTEEEVDQCTFHIDFYDKVHAV